MTRGGYAGMLRLTFAVFILGLLLHAPARAAERDVSIANLTVTVWESSARAAAAPVIFSHGFHGCATQSRFLTEALARAGYAVFAPNHADAACHGGTASWLDLPQASFVHPEAWTDATYRDRADDIRRLVAALHADPRWSGRLDWSRLALVGHSLGGYTVLGLAGAWPGWRLPGVRAVLALSPYAEPFLHAGTLRGLAAPVMYQGGTLDFGITPAIAGPTGAYAVSPPPKFFVEFRGASHFAWTDFGRAREQAAIVAYTLAFLAHELNATPAPLLHHQGEAVATLRFADP